MERAELNAAVDALLKKIDALRFDDYYTASSLLSEFKSLAHQGSHLVGQFTTEHVDEIELDFKRMRDYKRDSLKRDNFNSGVRGLRHDVESMKR